MAGAYPAILLARLKTVDTLKDRFKFGGANLFSKSLITLQFALSTILILGTLLMSQQLHYLHNKNLGFNKDQILNLKGIASQQKAALLKQELSKDPNVLGMSSTTAAFSHDTYIQFYKYEGLQIAPRVYGIDTGFMSLMDIELTKGRNFRSGLTPDSTEHVIVNEAFVKELGITNPIGTVVENRNKFKTIIGVTQNFHDHPLRQAISPVVLTLNIHTPAKELLIKTHPSGIAAVLKRAEKTWQKVSPDRPFSYGFLDEDFAAYYEKEERWQRIILYSSILALVVACMGLFGLIGLQLVGRKKEISIRKILGASVKQVGILLSKDFVKLVFIAFTIACPIAWYLGNQWLENFAYRISISPSLFLAALGLIGIVFGITMSYHLVRVAHLNPVHALKDE